MKKLKIFHLCSNFCFINGNQNKKQRNASYRRSICVDYMYYNPDGAIKKVVQTTKGVNQVKK
mgnify:FL=1